MKKEKVKIIIWGFGAMGSGIADALLKKKGVEIVGAIDIGDKVGKSIYDYLEAAKPADSDVLIGNKEDVITEKAADVVILCTDSFTRKAYDKIIYCLEKKINVITSAEEMGYPQAQEPELSKKMDEIAKENGVSVLGTGINPGLIMDLLVVCLTGACLDIDHITARRVNSLSPFGPAVMEEQGIGTTVEEFNEGVETGKIAGHVGFHESITMIADAIGWKLSDEIKQTMEPIVTNVYRKAPHAEVQPGLVAGCAMKGYGYVDGEVKIEMDHPQQIEPELEGTDTGDYVIIKGTPDINVANKPEVSGGIGTIAMIINMIPHIINSKPGLRTMIDLPVPRAILGDMREFIE